MCQGNECVYFLGRKAGRSENTESRTCHMVINHLARRTVCPLGHMKQASVPVVRNTEITQQRYSLIIGWHTDSILVFGLFGRRRNLKKGQKCKKQ